MDRQEIAQSCKIDPIIADILIERAVDTPDKAQNFLFGNQEIFHEPTILLDMSKAVSRIWQAVDKGEKIAIVGDSDADGITATAVLLLYLQSLGADVDYIILDNETLPTFWRGEMKPSSFDLLISVDTGISSLTDACVFSPAQVIITDHHECKTSIPNAYAVIDPKRADETYPFSHLSGAGVALKLVCAMASLRGDAQAVFEEYCDLVAIGTVADAMPLVDENRYIVKQGIQKIQKHRRVGLDMLLKSAGYNLNRVITAPSIGFVVAPRLNAAGRINRSDLAIELLCTEDYAKARVLSDKLAKLNRDRQEIEAVSLKEATQLVETEVDLDKDRMIVLRVEDWPSGIPGIVASRLVDRYAVPCVIVSFSDGVGRGSGRSVKGFDMFCAMQDHAHLLSEFGGHELAAGFTICEENYTLFKKSLRNRAEAIYQENGFANALPVSAKLDAEKITVELARQLQLLEPFGMENPQPLFMTQWVYIEEMMPLANERHLKLLLKKDQQSFTALMFGHTMRELHCAIGDTVDIIYALDITVAKETEQLQLIIKNMELSESSRMDQYEEEYRQFMAGAREDLPPQAVPDRKDIIDVYSYLVRTMGEGEDATLRHPSVMARRISRAFGKAFNVSQLMLSLQVLRELKMVEVTEVGQQLYVLVTCSTEKKNLSQSALWMRLKR